MKISELEHKRVMIECPTIEVAQEVFDMMSNKLPNKKFQILPADYGKNAIPSYSHIVRTTGVEDDSNISIFVASYNIFSELFLD